MRDRQHVQCSVKNRSTNKWSEWIDHYCFGFLGDFGRYPRKDQKAIRYLVKDYSDKGYPYLMNLARPEFGVTDFSQKNRCDYIFEFKAETPVDWAKFFGIGTLIRQVEERPESIDEFFRILDFASLDVAYLLSESSLGWNAGHSFIEGNRRLITVADYTLLDGFIKNCEDGQWKVWEHSMAPPYFVTLPLRKTSIKITKEVYPYLLKGVPTIPHGKLQVAGDY